LPELEHELTDIDSRLDEMEREEALWNRYSRRR
jgi:vacuolar-type H+-ATPase subunit D/Vma8